MKIILEKNKGIIYKHIGAKLAEMVKVPIIVTGGARNVDEMNEILNSSKIQYFELARHLMCESDLIKKWKEGKTKKAKCVSCNSYIIPNKDYATCIFNRKKKDIERLYPADFQSIKMGEYKITYLPDGKGYTIPSFAYFDSTDEDWNKKKKYLNKEGKSLMSIGSFLIEYKTEKILFDLGLGDKHFSLPEGNWDGGDLLENLKKAGFDRKDISKVIYSHFHPSYVGWTSIEENGKRVLTFPNANYYSTKNEWDFWANKIDETIGIELNSFKEPLEGVIKYLKDGEEVIPNLFVKYEFGHTPGMINLILEADGKKMWFVSDLLHSDLQFENPQWSFFSDNNKEKAMNARINLIEELAKPNTIIANGNFIEEAFGYLKKEEDGKYRFERYTK